MYVGYKITGSHRSMTVQNSTMTEQNFTCTAKVAAKFSHPPPLLHCAPDTDGGQHCCMVKVSPRH